MNVNNMTDLEKEFVISNAPLNSALLDCYTLTVPTDTIPVILAVYQAAIPGAIDAIQILLQDTKGYIYEVPCIVDEVKDVWQKKVVSTTGCKVKWIRVFHGFMHMTECVYSFADLPAEARRVSMCFSMENEEPLMCYKAESSSESVKAYVTIYKTACAGEIAYRGSVVYHDYESKSLMLDEGSTVQELVRACKELVNKQFYYGVTWKKLYAK